MKKLITISILLMFSLSSYSQVIQPEYREASIDWSFHPDTNEYIIGGMMVGTFLLLQMKGDNMTQRQRSVTALSCMGATVTTFIVLEFNLFKKK